jgi:hypothetical protein
MILIGKEIIHIFPPTKLESAPQYIVYDQILFFELKIQDYSLRP